VRRASPRLPATPRRWLIDFFNRDQDKHYLATRATANDSPIIVTQRNARFMPLKRFLLPPLDSEGQRKALTKLLRKHHRKGLVTMGWIENVFPGERGWCDQPGNRDLKRRVFYARLTTRRADS